MFASKDRNRFPNLMDFGTPIGGEVNEHAAAVALTWASLDVCASCHQRSDYHGTRRGLAGRETELLSLIDVRIHYANRVYSFMTSRQPVRYANCAMRKISQL